MMRSWLGVTIGRPDAGDKMLLALSISTRASACALARSSILLASKLVDTHGRSFDLAGYRGQTHVVLVITRGFPGFLCPYCTTQTSRLIPNYGEFVKRGGEGLGFYPGERGGFEGADRANFLLDELIDGARRSGVPVPYSANTPYLNTIPPVRETPHPGDQEIEYKIRSLIRWKSDPVGGLHRS